MSHRKHSHRISTPAESSIRDLQFLGYNIHRDNSLKTQKRS